MTRFQAMTLAAFGLIAFSVQASAQPGDFARGERMYRACVACHSLEPNRNMTGPTARFPFPPSDS
jgi:cytochrome c